MKKIAAYIKALSQHLFGYFSWQAPAWIHYLKKKTKLLYSGLLPLLILIGIGVYVYHWYKHLPQPLLVRAYIDTPPYSPVTPETKELVPEPLTIHFKFNHGGAPSSVAPLPQIGKRLNQGIQMTPETEGEWRWVDESSLTFTPKQTWPASQKYTITFDKKLFSPQVKMEQYVNSFTTDPLDIYIADLKFYQDLKTPTQRQVVATVQFNYPVNTKSFENHTQLGLQALKNDQLDLAAHPYQFTVSYDRLKRTAYIHSEPISLSDVPRYMQLIITKGVQPQKGQDSNSPASQAVLIPDKGSYFRVQQVNTRIVRDLNNHPNQVLNIELSLGAATAQLDPGVHAYLLPRDYFSPSGGIEKDYDWSNPGEVTEAVLNKTTSVPLQALTTENQYATIHSYNFTAPAKRYLYITIEKGIHSYADFQLANSYATIVRVPEFPKEITFLHKGSLLALNSEKKLSVLVRGVPTVKFTIAKILPNDLIHLVTQTDGDFEDPHFIDYNFDEKNLSTIFQEIQDYEIDDPSSVQYSAIDLSKYLQNNNQQKSLGLFLLKAVSWDKKTNSETGVENKRLILVTDMGLVVKNNADGSHDVFVQSIEHGTPVSQAEVQVLGKNGLPILSKITDQQGHVHLPKLDGFTDDRAPSVYFVQKDNDISFMSYAGNDRELNYSRFDVGGLEQNEENNDNNNLRAYLFSDRGIYRPGDTIHIGVIVKQGYAESVPAGLPVQATITDPRNQTVYDQQTTLNQYGFFNVDYKPEETAPAGPYTIDLYSIKDNQRNSFLGSITVQVTDFQPDRLKITANFSSETEQGWVNPLGLQAKIQLKNLYGTPAAKNRISSKITLIPQNLQFDSYPGYIFTDPLLDPKKPSQVTTATLPDTQTDQNGNAVVDLGLNQYANSTYLLIFDVQGFEATGGRSVSTEQSILVTPLQYLIGYKSNDDLDYVPLKSTRHVKLIAINSTLHTIAAKNLHLQYAKLQHVTTLVKLPDDTYAYKSLVQEIPIKQNPLDINPAGIEIPLLTNEIGDYSITVTDANSTPLSKLTYSIVGQGQQALQKNAELTVRLDKNKYSPGDTIHLQMTSPYTGAGLISIEQDKVYNYKWFKANSTSSLESIPLPKGIQGNGYVSVQLMRDWNSDQIYTNPFSYSISPFAVFSPEKLVKVSLKVPEEIHSGQELPIEYQTDKPGKIAIFVVDEGILQVAAYKTPDPFQFFFQKRALRVSTEQTIDQILPKYILNRELSSVGGDGAAKLINKNLNPFKRKTEPPVVFWSGIIDTDNTVHTIRYHVPDYFNGSLRVMAVAVTANGVGSAQQNVKAKNYFVISPNVTTFVSPGDEFIVTASISNNIKGSLPHLPVTVKLQHSSAITLLKPGLNPELNPEQQVIPLSENEEKTVQFKLRANNVLGSTTLTFMASAENKTSQLSQTISIRPATAYRTTMINGSSTSTQKLTVARTLYPDYRQLKAAASTSPLILISGLQTYLDDSQFVSTEQLVNQAFVELATINQPFLCPNTTETTKKIQTAIDQLRLRQQSNGAFSYWPQANDSEETTAASVYTMHFLTEAKLAGFTIPSYMHNLGLDYLKQIAEQPVNNLEDARLQAYAIYVLTRNQIITTNYVTHLQLYLNQTYPKIWQKDLTSVYLAATYQMLQNRNEAERLIQGYQLGDQSHRLEYNNKPEDNNSLISDSQYIYLLGQQFPQRLQKLKSDAIIPLVATLAENEINTLTAASIALALNTYAETTTTHPTPLMISEIDAESKAKRLTETTELFQQVNFSGKAKQIQFDSPEKQRYFYQLTQSGYDLSTSSPITNKGLEVFREYRDEKGNKTMSVPLGSDVEVHILFRSLDNKSAANIAIIDLLPGGFELDTNSLNSSPCDFVDTREDRVICYTTANPSVSEWSYKIRAINAGNYTVPPIFANSMNNPNIQYRGSPDKITVINPP